MATGNESNRKRFSNWLQCICCLNDTKTALHDHVVETWKKEIMSWDKNIRDHLPRFFRCVSKGRVKVKPCKKGKKGSDNPDDRKTKEKGKWICDCNCLYCNSILDKLLALQQNPGFNIVWNSNICEQLAEKGVEVESGDKEDYDMGDELESIPRVETSLLTWKKDMLSLDKDIRHQIPRFLSCVSEERIKIQSCKQRNESSEDIDGRKTNENEKWFSDCEHLYCNDILEKLLALQQNPGFKILSETQTGKCEKLESGDADNDADESGTISKGETSLLALVLQTLFEVMGLTVIEQSAPAKAVAEEIDYEDIFNGCKQEHIWCMANMFMQRGKAKTNISNTGPENTDASMFFKMTKNCKLFEIENENYLFDDIIRCRDLLHHSANNRVHGKEAENHFKTMIDLLKAFPNVPKCVDAIQKIEKMLKETILSVSVPDENLKGFAGKALKLKKSGLEVDQKIDRATGVSNDDISGLLKDTEEQIETISNPQSKTPLYEGIKSKEDFKQEIIDYKNRFDEMQGKIQKLENENQTLKRENEKEIKSKANYKREKLEYEQRVDDMKEKAIKFENENENLKVELEKEMESKKEDEREKLETCQTLDDIKQKVTEFKNEDEFLKEQNKKGTGIRESSQCTASEHVRMKDPGKHFENMTKLVKMYAEKEDILEALTEQLNPLLDQIVEDASGKDEEIKESLEGVYEEERHESEREKEENRPIGSDDTPDQTSEVVSDFDEDIRENQEKGVEQETNGHESDKEYEKTNANNFGKTREMEAEDVDVQSPDMEAHDDSEHLKSYTTKVEGDREVCDIFGCCMLPTGEILLADHENSRLKKFDDRYQVIGVCDLPNEPRDVCYCGNNEAVLAVYTKSLHFVDVRGGMTLIRKVKTDHPCKGLICHGNQLYVVDDKSVYIYSTDGIKQRVLYTHHSRDTFFWHIAVSDDGNYIYITDYGSRLYTIDSAGNHLYTFTDTELYRSCGVCVDGEDHVLVSQFGSNKVLQVSSDGKLKLGIIVDNINNVVGIQSVCLNRGNATLIVTDDSEEIHVLKLKKNLII